MHYVATIVMFATCNTTRIPFIRLLYSLINVGRYSKFLLIDINFVCHKQQRLQGFQEEEDIFYCKSIVYYIV